MKRSEIFDYLRLIAAIMVVIGHSFVLRGETNVTGMHAYGVWIFFLISGFLITASWRRRPNLLHFVERRARRIMPALIMVVCATVFVLGPLITTVPDYFAEPLTWKYLWRNCVLLPFHLLPGVFARNPDPAVNGSLWTLPYEVLMYAMTPMLTLAGRWICLAAGIALLAHPIQTTILNVDLAHGSMVIPFFLIGASLEMFGVRMPLLRLPHLPADLSYGIYLTAFPTQQTIIALYPAIDPRILIAATLVVVVPLAWLSWTFVESPLMSRRTMHNPA